MKPRQTNAISENSIPLSSSRCAITPGVVNGAHICESEGVPLTHYADLFPENDRARSLALSIHHNNFTDDISASLIKVLRKAS